MILRKIFTTISLSVFFVASAQEVTNDIPTDQNTVKLSYLDSIKSTFVYHEMAACVDRRWTSELLNSELFDEVKLDIENINLDEKVDYELSTELLKERLKQLDAKSAFHIEYNPGLENIIKYYLKNRKKSFERLIGLSAYYFPTFEEALARNNVPLEIKYLAVVESALNPRAVSRMGATGLWQFMYATGKQYQLDIDTYVDERSDLLKSSQAACQYMTNMYQIFGDWDLVLASYNAGPGNVAKAIRRSGGKQNYWNIRPFLPKETQGYVPAFLATMYVYEFHKEHGLTPTKFEYNPMTTDTLLVKNKITFKQLSDILDVSTEELQFLNPSYKRDFIPVVEGKKHYVRLPLDKIALFASNEEKVYAYAKHEFDKREKPFETSNTAYAASGYKYHTVRKGENLGLISNKYGVSVANLKKWNGLRSNNIGIGKKLKIETYEKAVASSPKPKKEITKPVEKNVVESKVVTTEDLATQNEIEVVNENTETVLSENTVEVDKPKLINHVIQKGENLQVIAQKYHVEISDLKTWNDLSSNAIVAGKNLKIFTSDADSIADSKQKMVASKKTSKKDAYYTVKKGDSLYSISQKLSGVTVSDLKKWNGIKGSAISPGMKLKIQG